MNVGKYCTAVQQRCRFGLTFKYKYKQKYCRLWICWCHALIVNLKLHELKRKWESVLVRIFRPVFWNIYVHYSWLKTTSKKLSHLWEWIIYFVPVLLNICINFFSPIHNVLCIMKWFWFVPTNTIMIWRYLKRFPTNYSHKGKTWILLDDIFSMWENLFDVENKDSFFLASQRLYPRITSQSCQEFQLLQMLVCWTRFFVRIIPVRFVRKPNCSP